MKKQTNKSIEERDDMFPFESKPDFVNDVGIKWWLYKGMTEKLHKGQVFNVEFPSGERQRVILQDGNIVYETQDIDSLCCRIDVLNLIENKLT